MVRDASALFIVALSPVAHGQGLTCLPTAQIARSMLQQTMQFSSYAHHELHTIILPAINGTLAPMALGTQSICLNVVYCCYVLCQSVR